MPRMPRVHYSGAIYHITARGNNRQDIFIDDCDKQKYLDIMKKYKIKHDFLVYAYVLMDNHIHLLMEVGEYALAGIMHDVQQLYARYFNFRYDRSGHVFQHRYYAKECANDSYLLMIMKYIHQNPMKAGITKTVDYRWGSHPDYVAGCSGLVDIDGVLGLFSQTREDAVRRYLDFIDSDEDIDLNTQANGINLDQSPGQKVNVQDRKGLTVDELISRVANTYSMSMELLCGRSRVRSVVYARRLIIYGVIRYNLSSCREVAKKLGLSVSQVSRGYYEVLQDKMMCDEVHRLVEGNG